MRWELLFDDLEARIEAEDRAQHEIDVADLIRAERARLSLVDRLRPHRGVTLSWQIAGGPGQPQVIDGELVDLGADWVLVAHRGGRLLVALSAIAWVGGLSRAAEPDDGPLARRMVMTVVLRGLARDRAPVTVWTVGGRLGGTIDRVGADHLDLAIHPTDLLRRPAVVLDVRCLPLAGVAAVASTDRQTPPGWD